MKFFLIMILFNVEVGRYRDSVVIMESEEACLKSLAEVKRQIPVIPSVIYSLDCVKAVPTGSKES